MTHNENDSSTSFLAIVGVLITVAFMALVIRLVISAAASEKKPAIAAKGEASADDKSETKSSPRQPQTKPVEEPPKQQEDSAPESPADPEHDHSAPKPVDPVEAKQADAPAEPPWVAQLRLEPRDWADLAMEEFDTKRSLTQVEDLRAWLTSAPLSPPPVFQTTNTSLGRCGVFRGVAKLTPGFEGPVALQLSIQNYNDLRLHCFHNEQGVTLKSYSQHNSQWAAYQSVRASGSARPARLRLSSANPQLAIRVDLRNRPLTLCLLDNEVVLTCGDLVLCRGSLPGLATEVILEGSATFQGIAVKPLTTGPPSQDPSQGNAVEMENLQWTATQNEKVDFGTDADGAARLTANATPALALAWTPIAPLGLQMVEMELTQLQAGSGVFLGQNETPKAVLRFVRNQRDGELCVAARADHVVEYDLGAYETHLVPTLGDRVWVRMSGAGGRFRSWFSNDGARWFELPSTPIQADQLNSIGLLAVPAAADPSIRLEHLRLLPFANLESFADGALLAKAKACSEPTLECWHRETLLSLPDNVALNDWRLATAVASLRRWTLGNFAQPLLWRLLEAGVDGPADAKKTLDGLDEGAFALDLASSPTSLARFAEMYPRLAHNSGPEELPFETVTRRMITAPIFSPHRLTQPNEVWLREELLRLVHEQRWRRLEDFARRIRFFGWAASCPLLPWGETVSMRESGRGNADASATNRAAWRGTVVEELDRDAFNLLAELAGTLEGGNPSEAARIIVNTTDRRDGLAPSVGDSRLFQSLSAALPKVWQDHPDVANELKRNYSEIAALRLQRAQDEMDEEGVRAVAEHFEPLEAAARAWVWLGDRQLSAGEFSKAGALYRRALLHPSTNASPEAADRRARWLLAESLRGNAPKAPADSPKPAATFPETTFSAAEFEQLTTQLVNKNRLPVAPRLPPKVTGFDSEPLAKLDGQLGKASNQSVIRDSDRHAPDWPIRQLAVVRQGANLIVSNRFQVASYSLADGKRAWKSEGALGEPMRAQDWFLERMRPLAAGDAIYARLLFGAGPRLVKLEAATGKVVWATPNQASESLVADPFLRNDQLHTMVMIRGLQDSTLHLATVDEATGRITVGRAIVQVRDRWWRLRMCELLHLPDGCVIALGGALLRCDDQGRVLWLRRQPQIPLDMEPSWIGQRLGPPTQVGDRLIYAPPGSRDVVCVALHTGAEIWRRLTPYGRGVVHADHQRTLVQTERGLEAYSTDAGALLWRRDTSRILELTPTEPDQAILVQTDQPDLTKPELRPQIAWLDLRDGSVASEANLDKLAHAAPHLGPLVIGPDAWWAFYGQGANDAELDLVRLKPSGEAISPTPQIADPWALNIEPKLVELLKAKHPAWWALSGRVDANRLLRDAQGKKGVLTFELSPQTPVLLAMSRPMPQRSKEMPMRLRLRVGDDGASSWKLEVFVDGERVHQQVVFKDRADRWATVETRWMASSREESDIPEALVRISHHEGNPAPIYLEELTLH